MIIELTLEQYSTILAIGSILLLITIIIHYIINKYNLFLQYKNKIKSDIYIKLIFILSILSLLSAMIYEFFYQTSVCPLC